jgi:recombinational DNA repair protein (RecF pathway)
MDQPPSQPLSPLPEAQTTLQVGFLLRPEQVAWIKAHARRNASLFMRQLLDQLMEQERREVQRLQQLHQQRRQAQTGPASGPR